MIKKYSLIIIMSIFGLSFNGCISPYRESKSQSIEILMLTIRANNQESKKIIKILDLSKNKLKTFKLLQDKYQITAVNGKRLRDKEWVSLSTVIRQGFPLDTINFIFGIKENYYRANKAWGKIIFIEKRRDYN